MNRHGQAMGGAILPEMMRWLWRDHPVSTDPRDTTERSMAGPPAPASNSGGTRPTAPKN
jgi:enterochelin esterase family protein